MKKTNEKYIDELLSAFRTLEKTLDNKIRENIKLREENKSLKKEICIFKDVWTEVVSRVNPLMEEIENEHNR